MTLRKENPRTRPSGQGLTTEPWLERLESALADVGRRGAPGDVHLLRVSSKRLELWLRLGGRRMLRDDLRWLRRAAAGVRDIDVALQRHAGGEVQAMLGAQRQSTLRLLVRTLTSARVRALLEALRCSPVPALEEARRRAHKWSVRLLARGSALDYERAELEELHRLRRRVRELRYAREWLGLPAAAAIALQDELGRIQDARVTCEQARALGRAAAEAHEEQPETAARLRAAWWALATELEGSA